MPTFTDENSALGDLNNRVKIPCCLPAIFGIAISLGAYLFARDASGYGLWLQVLLLVRSTRLYAHVKAHAVHDILLPLLEDGRVDSLMDPQSRTSL